MRDVVAETLGSEAALVGEPVMGGEDFSFVLERVPGAFGFIGIRNRAWEHVRVNHSPKFDMDESALPRGAAVLAATALKYLEASNQG